MPSITINGITLDPAAQDQAIRALSLFSPDAANSNYILLQSRMPLDKSQKAELAAKGVEILEYVPDNTYVCRYAPTDLVALRALPYIDWVNVYLQDFKIAPTLRGLPESRAPADLALLALRGTPRQRSELRKVDLVLHRDVPPEAVRDEVAAAAGLDPADLQFAGNKLRLKVSDSRLAALARIDAVRHIEEVRQVTLHNNVAREILRVAPHASRPPAYEGDGQTVAVCDTGFDLGALDNVHPAFEGRVRKLYALGRPGRSNDPNGHGTHVAGSVLADGDSAALGHKVTGTAPKAKLVLQSVLDSSGGLGGLPLDLRGLFAQPYDNDGARIHTNSWGFVNGYGEYNASAQEVDDFVWNHRDCVICFSAGNAGSDSDANGWVNGGSVTPPGTAKNCITVGASENRRPEFKAETYGSWWPRNFPTNPLKSDPMADDDDGMVAFSSRGPTLDGRIKPDVVAPGTFILSTRSRATRDKGWASSNDSLYYYMGGTSMATPLVAGCVALVREFLAKERGIASPSAALVKALLINGARNLEGQYAPTESGSTPNNSEGFGLVDVSAAVGPFAADMQWVLKDEFTALDSGEEEETVVAVSRTGVDLKATLVWTDPPGEALQNDLDLIVRAGSRRERHGNVPANARRFDRVNNVEQLVWRNLPVGDLHVVVRAWRVTRYPQSYALVLRLS